MRAIRVARPPVRVGVAVGADRITGAVPAGCGPDSGMSSWVHALESPPGSPGWGDELALALEAMRGALGTPPCRLYVTLLPPLVEVKRIELPPMRENELRRILSRDAERYFLQSREPLVVGIQPIGRSRRSPAPLLAIAAATAVVERVFEAAERNHCPLLMLGAAHFAWAVGPSGTRRSGSSASGLVEVRLGDVTEGLVLERGHLVLVRHARHSGALPLAGPAERAEPVDRILEPDLVAARFAGRGGGPEILPEREYRHREAASRGWVRRLLGCVAACLLLAAGVELWGRQRALEALVERRATIRSRVEQVMAVREALDGLHHRIAALDAAERRGSRWSSVLATVAERLPDDAHLIELRGAGDSLALAGQSVQATAVFEAIQRGEGVVAVRAMAPIRQEARDSGPPIERFALAARLGLEDQSGANP